MSVRQIYFVIEFPKLDNEVIGFYLLPFPAPKLVDFVLIELTLLGVVGLTYR